MFSLIRRWRRNRYRNIFPYWDGVRDRRADPLEVWRGLNTDAEFSLIKHPELIDAGDLDAMRIGADAIRRCLDIPSFARGGLTEEECLDLMIAFFDYTAVLKKNINWQLTSPSPLESSLLPPSTTENLITKPAAESFLEGSAPNVDTVHA